MSERADGLRERVAKEVHSGLFRHMGKGHDSAARISFATADKVLRAVVEELAVQKSWPPGLLMTAAQLVDDGFEPDGALVTETRTISDALATLLEASEDR